MEARALAAFAPGQRVHLVKDAHQENLLRTAGYPNALAVGLPFLYAPASGHPRRPGSLLAAPFHSLPEIAQSEAQAGYEETFARYLAGLRPSFSCLCVCLHVSCIETGLWISTLEKHGIPWVMGARTDDAFGLRRVRALFDSFDVVFSNALGSVIPYAAHAGARVCIHGPPPPKLSLEAIARHPTYQKFPELLERLRQKRETRKDLPYPFLRSPPDQASQAQDWAADELGAAHQVSHHAIARLFGWHAGILPRIEDVEQRRHLLVTLGTSPPALGDAEQRHQLAQLLEKQTSDDPSALLHHLLTDNKDLRQQNKQLSKQTAQAQAYDQLRRSWVWRLLAKPLYSIEKRLRGKHEK